MKFNTAKHRVMHRKIYEQSSRYYLRWHQVEMTARGKTLSMLIEHHLTVSHQYVRANAECWEDESGKWRTYHTQKNWWHLMSALTKWSLRKDMSILWGKQEGSKLRHREAGTIDYKWIRNKLTAENCNHPGSDMRVSLLSETTGLKEHYDLIHSLENIWMQVYDRADAYNSKELDFVLSCICTQVPYLVKLKPSESKQNKTCFESA